jgi:hypothetical protein
MTGGPKRLLMVIVGVIAAVGGYQLKGGDDRRAGLLPVWDFLGLLPYGNRPDARIDYEAGQRLRQPPGVGRSAGTYVVGDEGPDADDTPLGASRDDLSGHPDKAEAQLRRPLGVGRYQNNEPPPYARMRDEDERRRRSRWRDRSETLWWSDDLKCEDWHDGPLAQTRARAW